MDNSVSITLPEEKQIRMVSSPYFLITKLEAFQGRGNGDYIMSHDIEDIIAVLDGRSEMLNEIKQSDSELVFELSKQFRLLLKDPRFVDAVAGHMPADEVSQSRAALILKKIEEISLL